MASNGIISLMKKAITLGAGEVEIDREAVKKVFLDVLEERMTREAADRWAYSLIQRADSGDLAFVPPEERAKIWAGLMFLYGIDTLKAPGEYLHTKTDIRSALSAKLGDEI